MKTAPRGGVLEGRRQREREEARRGTRAASLGGAGVVVRQRPLRLCHAAFHEGSDRYGGMAHVDGGCHAQKAVAKKDDERSPAEALGRYGDYQLRLHLGCRRRIKLSKSCHLRNARAEALLQHGRGVGLTRLQMKAMDGQT